MNRLLAMAVMLGFFLTAPGMGSDNPTYPDKVAGGTINVVAFNKSGLVVVTDSALSYKVSDGHGGWTYKQRLEPGQKLFKIDDRTICTFAGFAYAPTSGVPDDFLNNVSAIMGRYERSLEESNSVTVEDKLGMLKAVFSHYLGAVANIRKQMPDEGDYRLELFIVGYEPDGTPKIGSLILRMQPETTINGGGFLAPVVLEQKIIPVDGQDVLVHGQRSVAEGILQDPERWPGDAAIAAYASSKRHHKELSILEMKALAISLSRHTGEGNPTVGGPDQIAVLTAGHVQSIDLPPALPPVTMTGFKFTIVQTLAFENYKLPPSDDSGTAVQVGPGLFTLYFKNSFTRVQQNLGESYFGENIFRECRLFYTGGRLRFDPSNQVYNSELVLGPGVDRNNPEVMNLMYNFPWKHVAIQGTR